MELKDTTNIRIIQTSHQHTGSTVLMNILIGFFCPQANARWEWKPTVKGALNNFIIKTHFTNLDTMTKTLSDYDLYFITSSRENHRRITSKNPRLLEIEYTTLLETERNSVADIVTKVAEKSMQFLPPILIDKMDIYSSIERINNMNKRYEEIKHLSFKYMDRMYGLHGSHRNRKN
jgi:hypothetical protein